MDIKILDSWLRDFLDTNAKPSDIAKCLSLCGPSIEKMEKVTANGKPDILYHIEVTTNRVDMMSVLGIAREASVILPQFGFKAELLLPKIDEGTKFKGEDIKIKFITDKKLVYRMIGVVMEAGKITSSSRETQDRLQGSGIRALNNLVDVTNYVMTEIGHPTHVFDYDLIKPVLKVRESKKGESVTSFDGKTYELPGGDIVFENIGGEIIDLPGIIGTKNSVVNENTGRILFFIETNNPVNIRKTSMTLGIRTVAATLNEKGVDPNLAEMALKRGILLYKKLGLKQISRIIDVYPLQVKTHEIKLPHSLLVKKLGIEIDSQKVVNILDNLNIKTRFDSKNGTYTSMVPTWRSKDLDIAEDLIEEVARIYGYHNLPSILMAGKLPEYTVNKELDFEKRLKNILVKLGGIEVYTLSLVPKEFVGGNPLKVKNPLGPETEYLRNTLKPSLIEAANLNKKWHEDFHIFEVANIYNPKSGKLPEEVMTLAGVISTNNYRSAKGSLESLLDNFHLNYTFEVLDEKDFLPNHALTIKSMGKQIGIFGATEEGTYYYEFPVKLLRDIQKEHGEYQNLPKFPPQVEDMTLVLPERTSIGPIYEEIKSFDSLITDCELKEIYHDSYTFRVWYQNPDKTLDNTEVEIIRKKLISHLEKKYKASVK